MSGRWPTKTLAEACDIRPSKSEASARLSGKDLVSFLPMEDLGIDQKTVVAKQTRRLSEVNGSYTYFADGDVLLAKITPCFENGKLGVAANLVNGIGFGSSEYIVLRPRPGLHPEWLYYFLSQDAFRKEGELRMGGAVGHKRVAKEFVESFPIPLPPIAEQARIVRILDEALAGAATAKANAEKALQSASALFVGELEAIFRPHQKGWISKSLFQIGTTQTGSTPRTSDRLNFGHFIPFVKPADFNDDGSIDYERDGLSEKGAASARVVPAGSTLMVCIGATIGKCGYVDRDVTTNQQINALTPTDGSNNRFLYYQMVTDDFQRRVIHGSGQATLPIINKSRWSELTVRLPPISAEQEKIAAHCDSLLRQTHCFAAAQRSKRAALEDLQRSVLHQAFSGAL